MAPKVEQAGAGASGAASSGHARGSAVGTSTGLAGSASVAGNEPELAIRTAIRQTKDMHASPNPVKHP